MPGIEPNFPGHSVRKLVTIRSHGSEKRVTLPQNQLEGFYDSTCLTVHSYTVSERLGQKSEKKMYTVYVYKWSLYNKFYIAVSCVKGHHYPRLLTRLLAEG